MGCSTLLRTLDLWGRAVGVLSLASVGMVMPTAWMATPAYAEGPYLVLTETVVDPNVWPAGQYSLSDGSISLDLNGGTYKAQYNWSHPPASMDSAGFNLTLSIAGQLTTNCQSMAVGTGASGSAFEFSPDPAQAPLNLAPVPNCDLNTPLSGNNSMSVQVKPRSGLSDGETVELKIGAFWGPGVTYRYKVTNVKPPVIGGGDDGGGGDSEGSLAATIECDSNTIVISALPSLNCHIVFTSWRRNTADPVVVSFPDELDGFGNHPNGIQLIGRGSEDIFNWDSPHRWGLFVFACPSQDNTGANCYGSITNPGPVTVRILVTQGSQSLMLSLDLTAVARGHKPPVIGGDHNDNPGDLAATLECDSDTIVISALPSLNCHIVFTSWTRNTAEPVDVSFPDELDAFGNHANGIQLNGRGNEDIFNWDSPHRWGLFVFACPSQRNTGANCYSSVTSPGPVSVNIRIRQGSQSLTLPLNLTAVTHPPVANSCGFSLGDGILAKWLQTGGEGGFLGCPTTNEQEAGRSPAGTSGRFALFTGGLIVWHRDGRLAGRAFEVHGCIVGRYQGLGGSGSWLGFPISDEYSVPGGGRRSDFEGGYILWDSATGGCIAYRDGSSMLTFETNINRPGSDYSNFELVQDSEKLCRDACAAEDMCVAYTYVRPGLQGPRAHCWLKSSVPPPSANNCCTSGVRR